MPQNLKSFLSELAVAPEKHARYLENPDEAMKAAGLNDEERAALKSGDPAKVFKMLSGPGASTELPVSILLQVETVPTCVVQLEAVPTCVVQLEARPTCVVQTHASPEGGTPLQPTCVAKVQVMPAVDP
jgi:hypothetical protein